MRRIFASRSTGCLSIYVIFAVASIVRYGWLVVQAVRGEGDAPTASDVGAGA